MHVNFDKNPTNPFNSAHSLVSLPRDRSFSIWHILSPSPHACVVLKRQIIIKISEFKIFISTFFSYILSNNKLFQHLVRINQLICVCIYYGLILNSSFHIYYSSKYTCTECIQKSATVRAFFGDNIVLVRELLREEIKKKKREFLEET